MGLKLIFSKGLRTLVWVLTIELALFYYPQNQSYAQTATAVKSSSRAASKSVPFKENKATLNFEDELVEGTTQKPDLFYLFQRKNFNYNRLIKLRENFLPEMRKTTEDIQRVRSSH